MVENRLYGTRPIAVHAPGRLEESPWWETVKDRVFGNRLTIQRPESLAILTWNSGAVNPTLGVRGHTLGWFERSLDHVGISYTVLGNGIGATWTNRLKLDLTLDFLEQTRSEYVLGADSSDALLVGDPGLAIAELQRRGAEVIFNAEKNCWPAKLTEIRSFERRVAGAPFRYLNSGLFVGTRLGLLRAFESARKWGHGLEGWPGSDQVCWKHTYRDLHPAVCVDDQCRIFQTLNRVRREIAVAGRGWSILGWPPRRATRRSSR